jgi:hypothetical protein
MHTGCRIFLIHSHFLSLGIAALSPRIGRADVFGGDFALGRFARRMFALGALAFVGLAQEAARAGRFGTLAFEVCHAGLLCGGAIWCRLAELQLNAL